MSRSIYRTIQSMKYFFIPLLLLFSSCVDVSVPAGGPMPNFKRYQPIYMNVSKIEVIEEYKSPMRMPNVEHLMPYSLADAMQIWVKQRMKARGGNKTMQVIIKDASVIEKELPGSNGLFDVFSSTPDREYNARLEIEVRVYGDAALSEASVNVIATRSLQMNKNDNVSLRDQKFRAMVGEMMTSVNAEMEKNIFQYLGEYVNFSLNP